MSANSADKDAGTGAVHDRAAPRRRAAPLQSRPSGIEAAPSAWIAGAVSGGRLGSRAWRRMPPAQARMSGVVTNCLTTPEKLRRALPNRAKTSTHSTLTVNTIAALHTAAKAMPLVPNRPPALVTPM
ncbi:hypothetical protein [Streptomyces sp. NPDC020747]|uniref:hypothetical protein n=1 Tax=Streptomyces sp. NPDC020747 TaxID=3365086 RepID=UPI0037BBFBF0